MEEEKKEKKKVLIVDDDEEIVKLIENVLAKSADNINIYTAGDGYEGILKVAEILPDLLVMDIKMPKIDGVVAMRQIRQRFSRRIKILVLTGYPSEINDEIIQDLEIDGVLTKPVDLERLQLKIKEIFS